MAYGRLDVFWPDGKIDTFALSEESVSVGRSPGNTVALDTDTISRYHFNILHEGDQVYLVDLDSANGTFIDGGRLNGNERYTLSGGEEIQIGHLRISYNVLDDSPTVPVMAAEDTQRIEKETRDFKIDLQAPWISVTPGSYTSFELIIANISPENQTYTVEVNGLPENWVRINRPRLDINARDHETVVINIKPLRRSDSKPGEYHAKVIVRPVSKPDAALDADIKVMIEPFGGFGMALGSKRLGSGEWFKLYLHNQGSAPLALQIMARDLGHGLDFNITPHQVNLAAGQRVQIQIEAKPQRSRLFGTTQEMPFDLVTHAIDLPRFTTAVRGYYLDQPPFSVLLGSIVGLLALAGLSMLFFGLILLTRTPAKPAIEAFIVNNGIEQVAQGDSVPLQWTVRSADNLIVTANGQTILTGLNPQDNRADLPTSGLAGEVVIALVAENRGGTTSLERSLRFYQPVTIQSFTVTPPQVVRNVVQTITLTWDTPGAASIELSDVAGFQTVNRQNNSAQIAGLASQDFTITLTAADDFGNTTQQTVSVRLVNAECTSLNERVDLHTQPEAQSPIINSIPRGTVMVVDARDQSGQWLRITLSGGTVVWANRADFDCADNFNVEDLFTVVVQPGAATGSAPVPPLVIITPSPIRTPAPAATPTIDTTGS